MNHALRTIAYFLTWGTFYGGLLGAWSGTAILPIFGTGFAAAWGTGIGAACGLLAGILTAIVQAYAFHPDIDLGRFRRRLTLGIGIFVPIAAAIMLIVTSMGLLWGRGGPANYLLSPSTDRLFLIASLLAAVVWGALSAAYVANAYPDWLVQLKTGQRRGLFYWPSSEYPVARLLGPLLRRWMNWGTPILGAMGGIIYQEYFGPSYARSFASGGAFDAALQGIIVSAIAVFLISLGNAALITFLKKTVFAEDVLPLSPRKRRWIFTLIAFVFTGITTVWTTLFAPLCALLMASYVYDAFPLFDETVEKAKHKEKNALALAEESQIDEEMVIGEDRLLKAHQR